VSVNSKKHEGLVVLGRFTAPYGVKGWIKIHSFTDPMENILNYNSWLVESGGQMLPVRLEAGKRHGKGLIAKLAGVNTPEEAKLWHGREILVPQSELPDLDAGEYYWSQLENLLVYTESGVLLGRVSHLMETGANDVLVVKGTAESIDREQRLIPWLPDQVVKEVDLDSGLMRVDWDPDF
jgi:16S rRNA processing protein RimM